MQVNIEDEKPTCGLCRSVKLVSEPGTSTPTGGEPPGEMAEGQHWLGLMWLLLACEMVWLRETFSCDHAWEVMPDVLFHRELREVKKVEREAQERAKGQATAVDTKSDWFFFKEILD